MDPLVGSVPPTCPVLLAQPSLWSSSFVLLATPWLSFSLELPFCSTFSCFPQGRSLRPKLVKL